jgi:Uma2 family endonuclease
MSVAERLTLSYEAYLALEAATGLRHQYVDGVAYAMAGSDPEHANVTANAIAALGNLLRGGRCRVYTPDLKLRIPETGNAYYADATVVCGKFARHPGDAIAVTNPTLLVEVLSPSTETFDRGDKFADYQRLASLRHYLLVSIRTQRVEHYRRNDDGSWTYTASGVGGAVELPDLGGALAVDELYVAESE